MIFLSHSFSLSSSSLVISSIRASSRTEMREVKKDSCSTYTMSVAEWLSNADVIFLSRFYLEHCWMTVLLETENNTDEELSEPWEDMSIGWHHGLVLQMVEIGSRDQKRISARQWRCCYYCLFKSFQTRRRSFKKWLDRKHRVDVRLSSTRVKVCREWLTSCCCFSLVTGHLAEAWNATNAPVMCRVDKDKPVSWSVVRANAWSIVISMMVVSELREVRLITTFDDRRYHCPTVLYQWVQRWW